MNVNESARVPITSKNHPAMTGMARLLVNAGLTAFVVVSIAGAMLKLTGQSNIVGKLVSSEFVLAALLAVLYRAINPLGWVAVLSGLGYRVRAISGVKIWLGAEAHRWLPGGLWGYASRAVQSKKLGVPIGVASASMLIELVMTMAAAVLVSVVGLVLYFDQLRNAVGSLVNSSRMHWQTLLPAVGMGIALVAVSYLFRSRLISKLQSLNEKWRLLHSVDFDRGRLLLAFGYLVAMACLNGIVNLVILRACSAATVPVTVMIAATAAAWVIGYLAFFSPGGLFVREAVLATLLLPWIPYPTAFAVAILSRIGQLIAEVICMLPLLTSASSSSGDDGLGM